MGAAKWGPLLLCVGTLAALAGNAGGAVSSSAHRALASSVSLRKSVRGESFRRTLKPQRGPDADELYQVPATCQPGAATRHHGPENVRPWCLFPDGGGGTRAHSGLLESDCAWHCFSVIVHRKRQAAASRKESQAWALMYGLAATSDPLRPPAKIVPPQRGIPRAPYLEDCAAVSKQRQASEQLLGKNKAYPGWTCASEGAKGTAFCDTPTPPWVVGLDGNNLPLTRRVQRDLWVNQFPKNCADPSVRLLVYDWAESVHHGLGSQLHLITVALSIAYMTNRTLVPGPKTFERAMHDGCEKLGKWGSLGCYFLDMTSRECIAEATRSNAPLIEVRKAAPRLAMSSERVIRVGKEACYIPLEASAAVSWGTPWAGMASSFLLRDKPMADYDKVYGQVSWWRSQAVRFILRWPSAYLCHQTNAARHKAYGRMVAELLVGEGGPARTLDAAAKSDPRQQFINSSQMQYIEASLAQAGNMAREPYVPRPIISMHVREGDKAREMRLLRFGLYMTTASRMRKKESTMSAIWLSTLAENPIRQSANYKDWMFLYMNITRQEGQGRLSEFEASAGLEEVTGTSFTDVLIASQCDAFVGVLDSNLSRLINELRMTNGRLNATYVSLNHREW